MNVSVSLGEIIALLICLLLCAFFSGAETALVSLNRIRLKYLVEKGEGRARIVSRLVERPEQFLATLLVAYNLTTIAASAIGTGIAIRLFPRYGLLLATILISLLVLILGEATPKTYAAQDPERVSLVVARPLEVTILLSTPLVKLLTIIANAVLRLLGREIKERSPFVTEEELKMLVSLGEEEGVLEEEEREMIHGIFEFGDKTVKEVMTPRVDMEGVNLESDPEEIVDQIVETGHSRVPVYRENIDNIVGIAYTRDLLNIWRHRELVKIQDLLRPPYFVPETKKLSELFREFKEKGLHIAIIVDEYGGTAGLVTMEDLLEEIVGEILDEYEGEERRIERLEDGFLIDARIDLDELNENLDLRLPKKEGLETLGGFIIDLFGRVPAKGEKIGYGNLTITIAGADRRRVLKVKLKVESKEGNKGAKEIAEL